MPEVRRDFRPGLFAGMTRDFFFPEGAAFLDANPLPARLYHLYTRGAGTCRCGST